MELYTHPREKWSEAECRRRANHAPRNAFGDRPPKGIIARCAASYPEYGQTVRFNGGRVIDGEWYQAEHRPLPEIPDTYEFASLFSWGTIIRKKQPCQKQQNQHSKSTKSVSST